jgi:hypothetical protein
MSTGKTSMPKEYIIIQSADFFPTPGKDKRNRLASFLFIFFNLPNDGSPNSLLICTKERFILSAFCDDKPPENMAISISFFLALRASLQQRNFFLKP